MPLALSMMTASCSTSARTPASGDDPYLWLEQVESPAALDWVKARNARSEAVLAKDPKFAELRERIHSVLVAKDRIPSPALRGGWVYNFWQDASHVKGLWRRTRPAEFGKTEPAWETLLDLDELSKKEGESWVWRGANCLAPGYERCLLSLSRGGKDAVVVREFDIPRRVFVTDGFTLPEAKSDVGWMDADTLWVGTDFGDGSLTHSGYPRIAKLWRRGTPLASARQVFEGKVEDVAAGGYTIFSHTGPVHLLYRSPSFFESEASLYFPESGAIKKIPFPRDADFKGAFQGQLLALLRSDWGNGKRGFSAGSLVSLPIEHVADADPLAAVQVVYEPGERSTLSSVAWSKSSLYLDVLENVKGRILKLRRTAKGWTSRRLPFPDSGIVRVTSVDPFAEELFAEYESFLVPTTLYSYPGQGRLKAVKRLPERFDARGLEVSQHEAVSRDGTKIPYFLVHKKGVRFNGENPTLLYGYGGFEVSMTPYYMGATGKVWLERGGVFALANIRGGGEFGPKWHQAAILENRQKSYDDFISVAADLNRIHVTSPKRLGIMGGSNGGLLMGVMLTQRPDLFKAIVCQVPLLDMLRYNQLLAGASWMGEYGNPEDPAMRAVIARYSPYQNVKAELKYPRVFFETSTKDDRVHPGHARKMVARMEAQGHEVLYFENIEGGHSAAADLEQRAKRAALEYTYLWNELGSAPSP
jgi:prolyl oligopeptidase